MKCVKCEAEIPSGSLRCAGCGTPAEETLLEGLILGQPEAEIFFICSMACRENFLPLAKLAETGQLRHALETEKSQPDQEKPLRLFRWFQAIYEEWIFLAIIQAEAEPEMLQSLLHEGAGQGQIVPDSFMLRMLEDLCCKTDPGFFIRQWLERDPGAASSPLQNWVFNTAFQRWRR
jgi:hypothetical protein